MHQQTEEQDRANVTKGVALSTLITAVVTELVDYDENGGRIGLVALVHAAVRMEVCLRAPGVTAATYRSMFHEILDEVLDYEERIVAQAKAKL